MPFAGTCNKEHLASFSCKCFASREMKFKKESTKEPSDNVDVDIN